MTTRSPNDIALQADGIPRRELDTGKPENVEQEENDDGEESKEENEDKEEEDLQSVESPQSSLAGTVYH